MKGFHNTFARMRWDEPCPARAMQSGNIGGHNNVHPGRLLPDGTVANLKNVKYSNYCDVSLHIDVRTGTLVAVAAIDNMVKGAAGQAIQNMNIVFGLDETTALTAMPPAF